MILAFTEAFIMIVYAYLLVKWVVICGVLAGLAWLIYRAGEVGMFK